MAKKQLNVKLLALVFGLLAVGVAVVGGILLVQFRNDPVKHIRKADALMAEGNVNAALKQYGRGVGKAPYEMAYYDKMLDALGTVTPETAVEANARFQTLVDLQIQRAQNATDSEERTAAENRALSTAAALDALALRTWAASNSKRPIASQVTASEGVANALRGLDQAIQRTPVADRDPRVAAAVRARIVEPLWRRSLLDSKSAWRESLEDIVEATTIDPTYVPIHFGRLHGLLDRYDQAISGGANSRAVRRLLEEEQGFNPVLGEVRTLVGAQPTPELDLIEQNRNYIAFLAGLAGSDADSVSPLPDPDVVRTLAIDLPGVDASEKAYRLELLRRLIVDMDRNEPTDTDIDPRLLREFRTAVREALEQVVSEIVALDEDDYRAQIMALQYNLQEIGGVDRRALIDRILDAPPPRVGVNAMLARPLRNMAIMSAFQADLTELVEGMLGDEEASDEDLARLAQSFEAVQNAFPPDISGNRQDDEIKASLDYHATLGRLADRRGDERTRDSAYRQAGRALNLINQANQTREDDRKIVLTPFTMFAGVEVARYLNQAGTALDLYRSSLLRDPQLASDFQLRLALVSLLFESGRTAEAEAYAGELAADVAAAEAAGVAVDDVLKTRIEMAFNNTATLNTGGVMAAFPGAELLAEEQKAMYVGDVAERRRVLDQILDQPKQYNEVIVETAALRRAALEANEGDFDRAKEFATMVLELNPDAQAAKLILRSDETTSMLERARIIAELANEDEQDQDVAVIKGLSTFLGNLSATIDPAELAVLAEERDRLVEKIDAAEEKRLPAIRLLAERALNAGEFDRAEEYIDLMEVAEEGPTPLSIVLRAANLQEADRTQEAIAIVENAIESLGFGDDQMLNVYADLLVRIGDPDRALIQYERAFNLAPNRPRNAINYARALQRGGRDGDALAVLRAGKNDGRRSRAYRDIWLNEEIRVGNIATAIEERRRQMRLDPTDFTNAMALCALLAESRVDRQDIRHFADDERRGFKAGEEIYTEAQWSRIPIAQRRKIQQEYLVQRTKMAQQIFDDLLRIDKTNPNIAVGASRFYRKQGAAAKADEVLADAEAGLRGIIEKNGNSVMTENQARDRLARVLVELGRRAYVSDPAVNRDRALEYFAEAVEVESPFSGTADAIIVTFLGDNLELELAAQYQAGLLEEFVENERADREIQAIARRLVELQVAAQDPEAAAITAERFIDADSVSPEDQMALGAVAFGLASQMRDDGASQDEIMSMLDKSQNHYREAARMSGGDVKSAGMAASITEARWRWADELEQEALYEQLVSELQQVVSMDEASWPARRALVDALIRNRDLERAAIQLRDFLDTNPRLKDARLRLVSCLDELGNSREAIDVAQVGFDLSPSDFDWAEIIGQLRADAGQYDEAAEQFGQLYQETEDPKYLNGQVRFLLARTPPAADAVIALARENNQYFTKNPYLMGSYSVALADAGRRSEALQRFESAYRLLRPQPDQLPSLAMWMSRLHPDTFDGAQALQLYADEISGNDPGTVELLELAVKWQQVAEDPSTDAQQAEEARSLGIEALRRASEANTNPRGVLLALIRLGAQLDAQDDCEGAIEAFERGLEVQRNNPELLNNLAYLETQCGGDLYLALKRSQEAVRMRPADPTFRDTLGTVLLRIAREESSPDARGERLIVAERELRKAVKFGGQAWPWIHLAELKTMQGDPEEARLALRKASEFELSVEQKKEIDQVLSELGEE